MVLACTSRCGHAGPRAVLAALQYSVMVTAGANQALASLMLTLLDPADKAVLFKPYYFNALMALQASQNHCQLDDCWC